ncbi:MAG: hypothetical protein ACNA7X_04300 [Dehalococcoidia bacterium]
MNSRRWIITNLALIGMAAAWLVPFICILLYGPHLVNEPSLPVLILEIAVFVGIIALAVYNLARIPP